MCDFTYDASSLPTITALDYGLMSASFADFPDLGVREIVQSIGARYRATGNLIWNVAFEYHDYQDHQPYLYDTTGRRLTYANGFSWIFWRSSLPCRRAWPSGPVRRLACASLGRPV